ncbi:MAG: hypothetical protein SFV51_09805 [Bryobacteraceae bacterium]|nr:hypothetical protein [Bryobacteraceae bacterium]
MVTKYLLAVSVLAGLAQAQPTYSGEVSRIMQEKCQMCHRPNDIAPFPLSSFEDAQTWAADIKRVVSEGIMPPWKPVEGHGDFQDAYNLTAEQRRAIIDWVDAGAPMGDPAELPEPKVTDSEWRLGEPDLVAQMAESYSPPRGRDVYRCFVVSNPFDETMYVSAVDVLPGNRKIVHHVIMFIDEKGQSPELDAKEEGPGYTCFGGPGFDISINSMLGGWAPGSFPRHYQDGLAIQIPKGARLVMQVHYFPTVTAEDVTRVGLYLAQTDVKKLVRFIPVLNDRFRIPPGAENQVVTASFPIPPGLGAKIIQVFPHMHLLGRQIKVEFTPLGRETIPLIYIDNWDFNWQGFYNYKEQVSLPALSNIRISCTFDNSENNPRNPNNPLKEVRWGEGTQDEMCLAFLGVTFDNEDLLRTIGILNKNKGVKSR